MKGGATDLIARTDSSREKIEGRSFQDDPLRGGGS